MPAAPSPPDVAIDTGSKTLFNDSLRTQIQAAMDAKGKDSVATAKADVTPAAPAEPAAPAKPAAEPAAPSKPAEPATPAAPAKPDSKLPSPDTYVPGATKADDWKRIKAERDAALARATELEAKVKGAPDSTALATLQQERDQYRAQLQSIAIERDPAFDKEFSAQRTTVLTLAKNAAGPELAGKIDEFLSLPPGKQRDTAIQAVMEALPSYKQVMLGSALADLDKIALTRESKIAESRANWEKLQAQAHAEQLATEARQKAVLEDTIAKWADPKKGFGIFAHKEGDPDHNAAVDSTLALARDIYHGNLDYAEMAKAALWAGAAGSLLKHIESLQSTVAERDAEIAKLTGQSPGAGDHGTGGTSTTDTGDDIPAGTDYASAIAAAVKKAGLR